MGTATKFVKINTDRGYGNELFAVLEDLGFTYKLRNLKTLQVFNMFKAHCHTDRDTIQAGIEARKTIGVAAQNIGRNGRKGKK